MFTTDPTSTSNIRPPSRALPIAEVQEMVDLNSALTEVATDAAIWPRETPSGVTRWLEQVTAEQWPSGRFVLSPTDVAACVTQMFIAAGAHASPALAWLSEDAQRLAYLVRDLAETPKVRLRLEPVFDNACAKFHIDNVTLRLICTYFGPGTELSATPGQTEAAHRVQTGAPILLKGKRWTGIDEPQLFHRSPPIQGTGKARLVMVLEGCTPEEYYPIYDQLYPESAAE